MIHKRKIPEKVINCAKSKIEEISQLHNSYMKVLNYQRWIIDEDTIKDIKTNSDFLEQLNKVYIGNVKSVSKDLLDLLSQFCEFKYKFIQSKECMFVDFENPNAAFLCLRELKGFKIGRTSSFCNEIPDNYKNPDPCILYLSNLDTEVTEETLKDIFPGIEEIKMSYNGTFRHRGVCYIRFSDQNVAKKVLRYFSELTLYNKKIYLTPLVIKMEIPKFKVPKLPDEVYAIKKRIDGRIFKRGRVLELKNILDVEEFDEDFKKEIRKELEKYGNVESLEFKSDKETVVICRFEDQSQCKQAFEQLNGRFFGGRRINAVIFED